MKAFLAILVIALAALSAVAWVMTCISTIIEAWRYIGAAWKTPRLLPQAAAGCAEENDHLKERAEENDRD